MPILFWGHGALSILVMLARVIPERYRDPFVRVICGVGAGLGTALFLERRSGDAWRTTIVEPTSAALAGVAIAAAWVMSAVLTDEDDRWRAAALVGLGGTALALLAGTRWTVTALLFWGAISVVSAAIFMGSHRRGEFWLALVLSDLCLVAGLVGHVLDSDTWQLPAPAPGRAFWIIAAAIALRVGVVPRFGIWRGLGAPGAPALPLLVGSALVLTSTVTGRAAPWAAVAFLLVGLGQAIWGAVRRDLVPADFAGWVPAVCVGLIFAAPEVAPLAGAAAILAIAALAIWPLVRGFAQPERGLLLTLAPLTAAFGAVVYVAREAFNLSTGAESVSVRVPWIVISALVPLLLAAGVLLGARVGRERSGELIDPWPLAATWLFVLASATLGMVPGALELPDDVVGSESTFLTLLLVAVGAGVVSGLLWSRRHPDHKRSPTPEPPSALVGPSSSHEVAAYGATSESTLIERITLLTALVLGLAVAGAIAWVTFEGLTQGFL